MRRWRAAPPSHQIAVAVIAVVMVWLVLNGIYQVLRKPTELYYPVSGVLAKTPAETWSAYGALFRKHATAVITPEFLAALAQVEGTGDPLAHTYWRWRLTWHPFEVYRPASSAVGMYQITDGTFAEAKHYCIHHHVVVEDGPWSDWGSCWFNRLYTRVVPSHAVEMTSALLDRQVAEVLARRHAAAATLQQKQNLAAVIHLCGAGAGDLYAERRFRLAPGQRCGDHEVARYLAKLDALKREFAEFQRGAD